MKMYAAYLFWITLAWPFPAKAQVQVSTDAKGRIVTLATSARLNSTRTYLGSPYLGNTQWHPGALLYKNQQTLPVEISYNLILNQIKCRLSDTSAVFDALPDAFIFENERFISDPFTVLGVGQVSYYQVLYDGNVKLYRKWRRNVELIDRGRYSMKVSFDDMFNGVYTAWEELFLQPVTGKPRFITLNVNAIHRVLPDLPIMVSIGKKLTEPALIRALAQYDSLSGSRQ